MWLYTDIGFFSAVCKDGAGVVTVRGRVHEDMVKLRNLLPGKRRPRIRESFDSDYRYRILISKLEFSDIMLALSCKVNYSNFKNKIKRVQPERKHCYMNVWKATMDLEMIDYDVDNPSSQGG